MDRVTGLVYLGGILLGLAITLGSLYLVIKYAIIAAHKDLKNQD